jgi:hypothetical protein
MGDVSKMNYNTRRERTNIPKTARGEGLFALLRNRAHDELSIGIAGVSGERTTGGRRIAPIGALE